MKCAVAVLLLACTLVACGEPEPRYLVLDVEVVEVYLEGGGLRITKTWRTTVKDADGVVTTHSGKLGLKGEKVKVRVKNPKWLR